MRTSCLPGAPVDVVRDAVPGFVEMRLVGPDEETWIDMWRWDSRPSAQAAVARAPGIAAAAAFSLVKDASVEFAEVVDER